MILLLAFAACVLAFILGCSIGSRVFISCLIGVLKVAIERKKRFYIRFFFTDQFKIRDMCMREDRDIFKFILSAWVGHGGENILKDFHL